MVGNNWGSLRSLEMYLVWSWESFWHFHSYQCLITCSFLLNIHFRTNHFCMYSQWAKWAFSFVVGDTHHSSWGVRQVCWNLATGSMLRARCGKICFSKLFRGVSDISALHKRHSLGCREMLLLLLDINPLYKSSLFSSHFKLRGISVAPCQTLELPLYPQVPWFSLALSTHKCQRRQRAGGGAESFWKIQSKHCNGGILPPDVRRQNTDWGTHCLTKSW